MTVCMQSEELHFHASLFHSLSSLRVLSHCHSSHRAPLAPARATLGRRAQLAVGRAADNHRNRSTLAPSESYSNKFPMLPKTWRQQCIALDTL